MAVAAMAHHLLRAASGCVVMTRPGVVGGGGRHVCHGSVRTVFGMVRRFGNCRGRAMASVRRSFSLAVGGLAGGFAASAGQSSCCDRWPFE